MPKLVQGGGSRFALRVRGHGTMYCELCTTATGELHFIRRARSGVTRLATLTMHNGMLSGGESYQVDSGGHRIITSVKDGSANIQISPVDMSIELIKRGDGGLEVLRIFDRYTMRLGTLYLFDDELRLAEEEIPEIDRYKEEEEKSKDVFDELARDLSNFYLENHSKEMTHIFDDEEGWENVSLARDVYSLDSHDIEEMAEEQELQDEINDLVWEYFETRCDLKVLKQYLIQALPRV